MSRRVLLAAALGAATVLGVASRAQAYPQFQFSSGTILCGQCHYSPAGYGLITQWGRDESADTISRGGDGNFLHGLVAPPDWLGLGGDVRLAGIRNDTGATRSPEYAVFPMQAELYARVATSDGTKSLYVSAGGRSAVNVSGTAHEVGFVSREHYLMYKPSATGFYYRIGRFYAPFGLRLSEHVFFVREFTGFNLYEETYNVSGGYIDPDWELHLTAFTPPPSNFPSTFQTADAAFGGSGGAAFGEVRFAKMAAVGGQTRIGTSSTKMFEQIGIDGKLWLDAANLLFLAEADLTHFVLKVGAPPWTSFVGYFGVTFIPIRGVMAGLSAERYEADLRGASQNAVDLELNYFPLAHIEVELFGRRQFSGSGLGVGSALGSRPIDGASANILLLQLHYYL